MLDSAIKVTVLVALALGLNEILRARSAALRHCVLAAALGGALTMPLVGRLVPAWDVSFARVDLEPVRGSTPSTAAGPKMSQAPVAVDESSTPVEPPPVPSRAAVAAGVMQWLFWLWIAGAAGCLFVLLAGLWRLGQFAARATPMSSATWLALADAFAAEQRPRRRIRLLTSEQQTLLVTWGVSRPTVLVPSSATAWSEERVRVVLGHEIAHIRRHDWLTLMIAEVVRALYWFNPLVWIACRRLREESERACDDMVLGLGIESTVYASHLLEIARSFGQMRRAWLPAPAMVRQSSLERRISAMLNSRLDRRPVTRGARMATIAAALALTGSIAGFGAAAQTFGSLPGSVVDSTNRPVAGATLVLIGAPNDAKRELKSDAAGHFEFVGLPPGDYRLEASAPGFSVVRSAMVVTTRTVPQLVTLQVGALMETVSVSGVAEGSPRELAEPVLPDSTGCVATAAGGRIQPPTKLRHVSASYPTLLYQTGADGHVVLDLRIDTDGRPRDIRVITSAHPDFDAAAIEAVRQWRFSRTLLNCVPVELSMTVHVNFVPRQP